MKKVLPAIFLGLTFLALEAYFFIYRFIHTPKDLVYLGTLHHPQDYFYYLSQFAQGKENWFTSFNLFTTEVSQPVFIGWVNVFLGKLFSLFGLGPIHAYILSVFLATGLLFFLSYILLRAVYGKKEYALTFLAFLFFILGNAFPVVTTIDGVTKLAYTSYWFNLALPFTRFGFVPHQIFTNGAIALAFVISIAFPKARENPKQLVAACFLLLLSGAILGSVQPLQLVITVFCLVLSGALTSIINKKQFSVRILTTTFFPSVLVAAAGFPFALYLSQLFTTLPYSQLTAWEHSSQIVEGAKNLFLSSGPVIAFSILGFLTRHKKPSYGHVLVMVYFAISVLLFLSPVPYTFGLANVRTLSAITFLCAAVLAAEGILYIIKKFQIRRYLFTLIILIFLGLSLPPLYLQAKEKLIAETANTYVFIHKDVLKGYEEARKRSTTQDTILAYWPMDVSFPGATGRRSFMGHPLLTINQQKKNDTAYAILTGTLAPDETKQVFATNNIRFILAFADTFQGQYPWVVEVYKNDLVTLFEVRL